MDNFYNSVDPAKELYQHDTHVSGTLRLVRGAPKLIQKLASKTVWLRGEMMFRRKENTFVICWQDVRLGSFITTGYDASTEEFVRRQRVRRGRFDFEEVTMQRLKVMWQYVNYMVWGGGGQRWQIWSADQLLCSSLLHVPLDTEDSILHAANGTSKCLCVVPAVILTQGENTPKTFSGGNWRLPHELQRGRLARFWP